MKCQFCGANLDLESEMCPFCGRENSKAQKYIKTRKSYQNEFARTEQRVKKQVKVNARTGRLIFIAVMVLALIVLDTMGKSPRDVGSIIDNKEQEIELLVSKNIDSITETLEEMERNREYLAMDYYVLNYRLTGHRELADYARVFSAVGSYRGIFEGILNIASEYDYFGEYEAEDWCKSIAYYITTWKLYVDGEFWRDAPDSPMHSGEHGAFLADIKMAVRDMVQVYYCLTDEQADAMWTMEEEELGHLLYMSIDSEVGADE